MKVFRQLSAALVLTLALCVSAFAGDIHIPGIATTGDVGFPPAVFAPAPGDMNSPPRTAQGPAEAASFGDILTPGIAILLSAILGA